MSDDDAIKTLDDHYYKGLLTFDQFILGVTLAAAGYLAQTGNYSVLGWNKETLALIPLLALGLASWLGFKRIEKTIQAIANNSKYLENRRDRSASDYVAALKQQLRRDVAHTSFFYRWRNRAIAFGLGSHVSLQILFKYPIF